MMREECGLYCRSIDLCNNTCVELQADLLLNCAKLFGNVLIVSVLRHRYLRKILSYLGFHTISLNLEASVDILL